METGDAKITALINDRASLSIDELRDLTRRYPAFPLPAITLLELHGDSLS